MKIVIAGKNNIAVDILKYAIDNLDVPIFVVLNKTENYKNGFQKSLGFYSKLWNIKILSLEEVYGFEDAVFISLEFDRIINPKLFKTKLLYNIHFSLLPAYKGMYTSALPLMYGEKKTGVTLHEIAFGIDTGNIIDQIEFSIDKHDTSRDLYLKYIELGTRLIKQNFNKLLKGDYTSRQQDVEGSTYFDKKSIDYFNLKLNFNQTAYQIVNQLRAYSFREYQLPKFENSEIGGWKITNKKSFLRPGKVVKYFSNGVQVSTIDFDLILEYDPYKSLWKACETNNITELESILNHYNINIETKTKEGWTALIIAVYNGSWDCILKLIEKGADINAHNYNYTTVLMYAKNNFIKTKDDRIINKLIESGADMYSRDIFGKTVLDWAKEENEDIYCLLKMKQ